ncbi:uncharacterized protein [Amphiura filiformis]|uniref:uncharacterized protein n=1 Tax=Amphiura filiformis TaxID=82378 RepID=UPI003B20D684
MAASMRKLSRTLQNSFQMKMCFSCFLRIGTHSRSFSSRVLNSTNLLRPFSKQNQMGGRGCIVVQPRRTSVMYFIMKSYQDSKKLHKKDPGPKFTRRYGVEGSIARELISYGAKVHFTNGKWYGRKTLKSWRVSNPGPEATDFTVNAVDATDAFLNQGAVESMAKNLPNVKYLNLDGCKYVDDHCLASLVHMRDTLTHLSINRCNQLTDGGIASLHKLSKLERLNMNDLPLVVNAKLVALLLEDHIPNLRIGMVTDQIDEYKQKVKLLKGMGRTTEEMDKLLAEGASHEEDTLDKNDTGSSVEEDESDAKWSGLIRENRT